MQNCKNAVSINSAVCNHDVATSERPDALAISADQRNRLIIHGVMMQDVQLTLDGQCWPTLCCENQQQHNGVSPPRKQPGHASFVPNVSKHV
jgi:hypothetical protein